MASKTYTKNELSRCASQVKRLLLNKISNGTKTKITKTEAFNCISRLLKLSSARTLWIGDTRKYLDEWFSKLEIEIQNNLEKTKTYEQEPTSPILIDQYNFNNLNEIIKEKNMLIKEYEKVIKVLREENDELRTLVIDKHGKIDLKIKK